MPVCEIEFACLVTNPFFFSDQFFWASRVQRLGVRVLTTSVRHLSFIFFKGGNEAIQRELWRAC